MTMDFLIIFNLILIMVLTALLMVYGLRIEKPYPKWLIEYFEEPYVRLLTYIGVYVASYMNPIVGLLGGMAVLFLHLDVVNLVSGNATKK